jgi:hypothetical protein
VVPGSLKFALDGRKTPIIIRACSLESFLASRRIRERDDGPNEPAPVCEPLLLRQQLPWPELFDNLTAGVTRTRGWGSRAQAIMPGEEALAHPFDRNAYSELKRAISQRRVKVRPENSN